MVESKVIINRKDYVEICERLETLACDISLFRESKDNSILDVMEKHIAVIQNILIEQ